MKACLVVLLIFSMCFSVVTTILPDTASATMLYVGGVGPGNYTTIQGAIDAASRGDTVFVSSGVYGENLRINKSLSIIGEGKNTTVIDGGESATVIDVTSDLVNIKGFAIRNSGLHSNSAGVRLRSCQGCNVSNNVFSRNGDGIFLDGGSHNLVIGNFLSNNHGNGIRMTGSDNNSITFNNISGNEYGINLLWSEGNEISENNISDNEIGAVYSDSSCCNLMSHNVMQRNEYGIMLYESTKATITDNQMTGGGIVLGGHSIFHWDSHSVVSNELNGKPIHYWKDVHNQVVPSGAGQIVLVLCTGVSVKNQHIDNTSTAITLGFSSSNIIEKNTASGNAAALWVWYSHSNNIKGNHLSQNEFAVSVYRSQFNTIVGNHIEDNDWGIWLRSSGNNTVHHNNIVSNAMQAFDDGENQWDDGYPSGGNYWSDYTGVDERGGPGQDEDEGDGIGDSPYEISEGTCTDRFPLMQPFEEEEYSIFNQAWFWVVLAVAVVLTIVVMYVLVGGREEKE